MSKSGSHLTAVSKLDFQTISSLLNEKLMLFCKLQMLLIQNMLYISSWLYSNTNNSVKYGSVVKIEKNGNREDEKIYRLFPCIFGEIYTKTIKAKQKQYD